MNASKPLAPRVLLVVAAAVIGLLVIEVGLRIVGLGTAGGDLRDLHVAAPEKPYLFQMRPNLEVQLRRTGDVVYRTNDRGFRGPAHPTGKPEDHIRIVLLGDSVSFGYGVSEQDAYPQRLARELTRRSGRPVEVLNLAVSGYNPYNQAALFRELGGDFDPDLVLVQFCINDLNDPTLHFDAQTRLALGDLPDAAFPDPSTRGQVPAEPAPPLAFCSALRLCRVLAAALTGEPWSPHGRARALAMAPAGGLPPGPTRSWLRARYAEIASGAAAADASFAVIAFPHEGLLSDASSVQRDLASLGDEAGWATLDLLPAFRSSGMTRSELFIDLWHPTAAGHRVAAEEIERQLLERGLLPGTLNGS